MCYFCKQRVIRFTMASTSKTRTLRAFTVENTTVTESDINLLQILLDSLNARNTLETRLMPLTSDEGEESDLLTSWKCERDIFRGIVRPVLPKDSTSSLPASFLSKEHVTTEELIKEASKSEMFTTLPPCYFAVSKKYIAVLFNNKYSQRRFETYINWLTGDIRKDYWIAFNDVICLPNDSVLSTTSSIVVGNHTAISLTSSSSPMQTMLKKVSSSALAFLTEMDAFKDLGFDIEDVLELTLLFKVNKKKIGRDDAERQISKLARLFSQEEDVVLKTKEGDVSVNKALKKTKSIKVETTAQGAVNESMLFAELEKFLIELRLNEAE